MKIKRILRNGTWLFFIAMGIQALTFKNPYVTVLGAYFLITSFIFFPWLDKTLNLIGIKLSSKNKWFLIVINLFVSAYLIKPDETNFYKCILPIAIMILMWVMTIFWVKRKLNK